MKILNIFVLAKLWYALESHDISKEVCSDINDITKTFVWNGYHQRQLSVLSYPNSQGGLALQSIEYKMETLKIRWIQN